MKCNNECKDCKYYSEYFNECLKLKTAKIKDLYIGTKLFNMFYKKKYQEEMIKNQTIQNIINKYKEKRLIISDIYVPEIKHKQEISYVMKRIYEYIIKNKFIKRKDICVNLKIPRTTVYDNLVRLQKLHLIEKLSYSNGKRGRPIIYWFSTDIREIK